MFNIQSADSYITGQEKKKTSINDKGKIVSMTKNHITKAYLEGEITRRTL